MDIDVTDFAREACPRDFSASVAEIGRDAGAYTWAAAMAEAADTCRLDTPEKLRAMRDFAAASGGWTEAEIGGWTDQQLNALFIQWISGDLREMGLDAGATWDEARAAQESGQAPSNLYRADDGRIYFSLEG